MTAICGAIGVGPSNLVLGIRHLPSSYNCHTKGFRPAAHGLFDDSGCYR